MAVAASTLTDLILDVGTFQIDGTDVGATEPEGAFAVEQELYWPEFGGARGDIAGSGKVRREHATLEIPMTAFTIAKLETILPTVSSSNDGTSDYTVQENLGYIGTAEHVTVKWIGETIDGKAVEIHLLNALQVGGLSANLSDTGHTVFTVTFRSFYTAAAPKQRPWVVYAEQ